MRRLGAAIAVVLLLTACGGSDTSGDSGDGGTTSATSANGGRAAGGACSLLTDPDLAVAFPDGAPPGATTSGENGETICNWGSGGGAIVVTLFPSEDFYDKDQVCPACEVLDIGQEAFLDLSGFFSLGFVLLDGKTLAVSALGVDIDAASFEALVRAAAGRA